MNRRILLFMIFLTAGVTAQSTYFPPIDDADWQTVAFESLGWQPDSLGETATLVGGRQKTNDDSSVHDGILWHENYPNPFNPETSIRFELSKPGRVLLHVYSIRGELATTPADGFYPAGVSVLHFNASRLAAGIYVYKLQTKESVSIGKMILVR